VVFNENLGALTRRLVEGEHEEVEVHRQPVHDRHLRLCLCSNDPATSCLHTLIGGAMGRPQNMCPRIFCELIVPETQCPFMGDAMRTCDQNVINVSMQGHRVSGTINLGTSGLSKFVRGLIVSGRPITPPTDLLVTFSNLAQYLRSVGVNNLFMIIFLFCKVITCI